MGIFILGSVCHMVLRWIVKGIFGLLMLELTRYIFSSFSMEMKTIAYSDWLMKHNRVVGRENQL